MCSRRQPTASPSNAREEPAPREGAGPPHTLPAAAVLRRLRVTADAGLAAVEARRRLERHGPNELDRTRPPSGWLRFLRHLVDPVILLLLGAASISLALSEVLDAVAIVAIVLVNAALAFFQEERAELALESLRSMARPAARVVRDGVLGEIDAGELVPGDVIHLEPGDLVPADGRLLAARGLRAQEASLTGESAPIDKAPDVTLPTTTPLADRRNLVFQGTVVATGHATAVVTATGMTTELGRIAGMLGDIVPRPTPLQARLARLGRNLAALCVAIAAGLALWYVLAGDPLGEVLVRSIGLAVAAVPEGLPAVVAIALALGMRRLVRANALMRRMHGVETLGSVTVICTDKTGTLTRNEMEVREVYAGALPESVQATDLAERPAAADGDARHRADVLRVLRIGLRCNNAQLQPTGEAETPWRVLGDPTEGALLLAAVDAGLPLEPEPGERVVFEVPFDSERRLMSVLVEGAGESRVYAKGAMEALLPRCTACYRAGRIEPLDATTRLEIAARAAAMGQRALRVLALACRDGPATPQDAEEDLVFAGLVGMRDPPREQVPAAVASCRAAGIRPLMITGDQADTALAIAREIGLCAPDDLAITGAELDTWSDADLRRRIDGAAVFARTSAEHKLRIIRALQAQGHVVAMTGDGINDAPALGEADIGIAMGRTGTEVTREAADLVLLDDDFATIVAAVREGRGIFDNIRKFVHYMLATNAAEVLFVLLAAAVGWPAPLSALHLLWINLLTDGLPALALGMEPVSRDVLERPPRPLEQGVVRGADTVRVGLCGLLVTAITAALFARGLEHGTDYARTLALAALVQAQLALVFAFRDPRRTLPELGLGSNPQLLLCVAAAGLLQLGLLFVPGLRATFGLEALDALDLGLAAAAGLAPVTVIEVAKLVRSKVYAARRIQESASPGTAPSPAARDPGSAA